MVCFPGRCQSCCFATRLVFVLFCLDTWKMPDKCIVFGCNEPGGHKFPKETDVKRRAAWIQAVKREERWKPTVNSRVCRKHFRPEDYKDGATAKGSQIWRNKHLKADVVPSVFTWSKPVSSQRKGREERRSNRDKKKDSATDEQEDFFVPDCPGDLGVTECIVSMDDADNDPGNTHQNPAMNTTLPQPVSRGIGIQVDLGAPPTLLSVESLEFDEELLHYFTGLESFDKFVAVFQSLGPAVSYLQYYRTATVDKVSPMNQFLLMLAKLRQDIDYLLFRCFSSFFNLSSVQLPYVDSILVLVVGKYFRLH